MTDASVTKPTAPPISLLRPLVKWFHVYAIFFQDALVYRATAFIWLMTDTVPAIIMPLLWLSS